MKSGKVWGETHDMFNVNGVSAKTLYVDAKTRCSKHKHNCRANFFFVLSGILQIRVWKKDYDLVDETQLLRGDSCMIMPGEYHQFEACTDVIAIEAYWTVADDGDIERETVGGKVPREEDQEAALQDAGGCDCGCSPCGGLDP